jgi:protein-S-isoprenylcysteine O-methyltransferase Ste14
MQATEFEFRHRWWIFAGLFALGFMAYAIDHVNSASAFADWLAARFSTTANDHWYRLTFTGGALLVTAAALIRTWGTAYLDAEVMRDGRVHTEKLVADGPYRYVRNPLYFGNILMAIGAGLMASRAGFAILAVGMTIFVLRLLLREENHLLRDQGESYRRYYAAVPRLVPSLRPRTQAAGNAPRWGQAFRAELMYWMISLAMGVFAATLNLKFFWGIFAVALATSFFGKRPRQKNAA